MAVRRYSRDIWDYLRDMPYMPSREDRDALVDAAQTNGSMEKRVHIWDYFFRITPEDVGKPQKSRIETLGHQRQTKERIARAEAGKRSSQAAKLIATGLGALMISGCVRTGLQNSPTYPWIWLPGMFLVLVGVLVYVVGWQKLTARLRRINADCQRETEALQRGIEALKRRIPSPPHDILVHDWLQEDIDRLARHAKEQTGLESRLINLKEAPNPLCILGPAELQNRKLIPMPFLNERDDRAKHLTARRLARLPDGRFEDFYGVYYIQFILVASDMLGSYGCFFDFITGKLIGEYTSEQYYHDVVSLSTRREYRQVSIGPKQFVITMENTPTFEMTLASGHSIEVAFASYEYFLGIHKQDNISQLFDPKHWVRNPEVVADNAIRALRSRLRKHKGVPGERPSGRL
jgi:hypothetical protein